MFRKINTKMLCIMLSIIILSMLVLTYASYLSSKSTIQTQIQENMDASLKSQLALITNQMDEVSSLATHIARNVQATYKNTPLEQYEMILGDTIFDNDLVIGSGIWFEPYLYDGKEKYIGPYVYKEGNKAVTTYDYSNAKYDYFQYDWYKNATTGSKAPVFSALYYDETMKVTMSSCTVPMYDRDNKLIGVVTADIDLSNVTDLINEIKIGEEGSVMLFNSDGLYLTSKDPALIMKASLTDSDNASLAALGKEILQKDTGSSSFTQEGRVYYAFYATVKDFNWKVLIQIPKSEVEAPLKTLLTRLITISAIMLLLATIAIITQVRSLTGNIKKVNQFALSLAQGNYQIPQLSIKTKDELGQMGHSLNQMLQANKAILTTIVADSSEISEVSNQLDDSTNKLAGNYDSIENEIRSINENMMSTSAATEEVNASVEEVTASIVFLSGETSISKDMATGIKDRAVQIKLQSEEAYRISSQIALEKEHNLQKSLEDAKIIDSIGAMASDISTIAEQVNLLALNASIEAARAGEHGKGFAVVAKEIGVLASRTSSSVSTIQQNVSLVQASIDQLMLHSKELLGFIKDTVNPDYMRFVDVAAQYGRDANAIDETVTKIAAMTGNMEHIVTEVGEAIQNITEVTQNTTSNTNTILENMEVTSDLISLIAKMVTNEREISDNLDAIVKQFKL